MLIHLDIKNFAVVDKLALEFSNGLTVLTGETGAGKSLLVDALGIILGDRSDSTVVRAGEARAELTASFDLMHCATAREWLEEHDLSTDEECLVTRSIAADGRSRAWINGRPVNIGVLREFGGLLADIHHQHAHQSLLKSATQRTMIDDYAGNPALLADVQQLCAQWQDVKIRIAAIQGDADPADRIDLLRYQLEELKILNLGADEIETLDADHKRLSHASELLETVNRTLNLLNDEETSAENAIGRALSELASAAGLDQKLAPTNELLESVRISLHETVTELRHYADNTAIDPERLAEVEQRVGAAHDLARKHRIKPEQLPDRLIQIESELDTLQNAGEHLKALQQESDQLLSNYIAAAGKLSKLRKKAARELSRRVVEKLHTLGMEHAQFEVAISAHTESTPRPAGLDGIEFLVTMNPGQPLQPLSKVASGGELSRISLAIQVIAAADSSLTTLVFDEVDVGVGGATAETVGRLLRKLGSKRQVLCVTHLPQVAAQGHQHLRVNKLSTKDSARTRIETLDNDQRVEEIARMLGGQKITAKTRDHAREMLGSREQVLEQA